MKYGTACKRKNDKTLALPHPKSRHRSFGGGREGRCQPGIQVPHNAAFRLGGGHVLLRELRATGGFQEGGGPCWGEAVAKRFVVGSLLRECPQLGRLVPRTTLVPLAACCVVVPFGTCCLLSSQQKPFRSPLTVDSTRLPWAQLHISTQIRQGKSQESSQYNDLYLTKC